MSWTSISATRPASASFRPRTWSARPRSSCCRGTPRPAVQAVDLGPGRPSQPLLPRPEVILKPWIDGSPPSATWSAGSVIASDREAAGTGPDARQRRGRGQEDRRQRGARVHRRPRAGPAGRRGPGRALSAGQGRRAGPAPQRPGQPRDLRPRGQGRRAGSGPAPLGLVQQDRRSRDRVDPGRRHRSLDGGAVSRRRPGDGAPGVPGPVERRVRPRRAGQAARSQDGAAGMGARPGQAAADLSPSRIAPGPIMRRCSRCRWWSRASTRCSPPGARARRPKRPPPRRCWSGKGRGRGSSDSFASDHSPVRANLIFPLWRKTIAKRSVEGKSGGHGLSASRENSLS
jgi:hypothetical protein